MRCVKPVTLKDSKVIVPCGKCLACKKNHASQWTFRILQECLNSSSAYFVTLTYENPPLSKNGFMTLDFRDTQLFMKKLRKKNREKLRFWLVGEYGGKRKRPHYHMLLFNADLSTLVTPDEFKDIERNWSLLNGKTQFHCDAWKHGHITIGRVEPASAQYCMMYTYKGTKVPQHDRDDRVREQNRMSQGIGKNYLNEAQIDWHRQDILRQYCILDGGKKITMPRYYKDRIYTIDEKEATLQYFKDLEYNEMLVKTDEQLQKLAKQKRLIAQNPLYSTHVKHKKLGDDPF